MLQIVDGREVYVVDFDAMPKLPITYTNDTEKPYAYALGAAIMTGVITEPGKYGIDVLCTGHDQYNYTIFAIIE